MKRAFFLMLTPVLGVAACSGKSTSHLDAVPADASTVHLDACTGATGDTVAAVVEDSGSTNTPAGGITVYCSGDAARGFSDLWDAGVAPTYLPSGSPDVAAFLDALAKVPDVSAIPTGRCAKSISFGSVTTLSSNGKTSGDIQCLQAPTPDQQALVDAAFALLRD